MYIMWLMAKWMDEPTNEWMNESVVIWKILESPDSWTFFPKTFSSLIVVISTVKQFLFEIVPGSISGNFETLNNLLLSSLAMQWSFEKKVYPPYLLSG